MAMVVADKDLLVRTTKNRRGGALLTYAATTHPFSHPDTGVNRGEFLCRLSARRFFLIGRHTVCVPVGRERRKYNGKCGSLKRSGTLLFTPPNCSSGTSYPCFYSVSACPHRNYRNLPVGDLSCCLVNKFRTPVKLLLMKERPHLRKAATIRKKGFECFHISCAKFV